MVWVQYKKLREIMRKDGAEKEKVEKDGDGLERGDHAEKPRDGKVSVKIFGMCVEVSTARK